MRLVITIPAYNEEGTIAEVIREIPRTIPGLQDVRVLVINDGSRDRTSEVARNAGADEILHHAGNKGLAKTFQDGIEHALAMGADIIVNTDADNHYNQSRIPDLIAPILEGRADVVIGGREVDQLEGMKSVNRQGNKLGSWFVSRIIGRKDTLDVSTGFRAYNREAALHMHVYSRHTYTHETIIQALDQQLTVVEVPIPARPVKRKSRLIQSIPSHIVRSLVVIFRVFTLYKPLRVMSILGGIIFGLGLAFIVRFLWFYFFTANGGEGHVQSLILASALIILGFQVFIIGLLASAIGWNRKLLEEILYRIKKEQTEHESPVRHKETSAPGGGMERYSADLIATSKAEEKAAIVLGRPQAHLLWWLPLAWIRVVLQSIVRKPDVIHATDALMAVLLYPLAAAFRIPLVVTVHALDVVWRNPAYQWILRRVLPKMAHVVSVSRPTVAFVLARGVAHDRVTVIPNGIMEPPKQDKAAARRAVNLQFGIPDTALLLLSVGRLIARKNMPWFVREVMPLLPERTHLLILGAGPEHDAVQRAIRERGLSRRVLLAGEVSDDVRDAAYAAADLFVMPNRTVPGDAEGFGIVAIEAAGRGLPVVTSGIEGIAEAITDGKNGVYFPEQNAAAAAQRIALYGEDAEARRSLAQSAAAFTLEHFSWERLAERYAEVYRRVQRHA